VSTFIKNIYTEVKSIKEAFRNAKYELKGTRSASLSAAQKVDPAVLWVLCTAGCRRKAMLSIYKDENTFSDRHQSWCCDRCAKCRLSRSGALGEKMRHDLEMDHSRLERSISFLKSNPKSHKIILLDNENVLHQQSAVFELPSLPVNELRRNQLKKRLYAARESIMVRAGIPSLVTPEMVIPDAVIDHVVQSIRKINSERSLEEHFQAAKFDISSSLIANGRASIPSLYRFITEVLRKSAHLERSSGSHPIQHA